ncbi:Arc family DNA-binding protein [Acinetobacter sp. 1245593]|uniref:Arc family DNA-binding protein n=1 Tax=Acinetobacter sp. 1245593 TaxID=1310728 RepID=UPI0004529A5A|nr:Arc family DNA-binding protein [Acinetobacter sp. 1245593]EXH15139.1 traY domain protein [Acinetobacter sp. 1245593]HDI1575839.1 Arc family DNA-binding protein [Acinetobacter baumannii]
MARTDPQVNFRIPAELKDKLDNAAKENGRTLTAELILRLEMTFEQDDDIATIKDEIETLRANIEYAHQRINDLEGHY